MEQLEKLGKRIAAAKTAPLLTGLLAAANTVLLAYVACVIVGGGKFDYDHAQLERLVIDAQGLGCLLAQIETDRLAGNPIDPSFEQERTSQAAALRDKLIMITQAALAYGAR